jgi:branched-chain amino acid transport system permease protein
MTATRTPHEPAAGDTAAGGQHRGMLERPLTRSLEQKGPATRLRGRTELYTAYAQDMGLLNTPGKRIGVGLLTAAALVGAFVLPGDWVLLLSTAYAACIGAIGLNIVTGYAGQVSLGHAFFLGLGAYTAATISGDPAESTLGFGITLVPVWLVGAGAVAALAGLLVAPIALRLRGLYLAIVTLGLVFLGEHIFKEAAFITGGPGIGRGGVRAELFGFDFRVGGEFLGVFLTGAQRLYLLVFMVLVVGAVLGRNLARSDLGRSFSAVRDRDIAAEVIGVDLTRAKVLAFVISSFYAGVAGALLYTIVSVVEPGSFNLLTSVRYIAMILIGGVATISGSIMGALFISMLGRFSRELTELLPTGLLSPELFEAILYGVLIIVFLIFEPRGLFGIWVRVRNYWKGWPFSY